MRRVAARLTRSLGPAHWARAEDAVQTAALRALQQWPAQGVPANPAGWLYTVARHAALDSLRHDAALEPWPEDADDSPQATPASLPPALQQPAAQGRLAGEIDDDELALVMACCHPRLPQAVQVALALRSLLGLALEPMAAALFTTPAALAQRLARARASLSREDLALPAGPELARRRSDVLTVLPLLFRIGQQALQRTAVAGLTESNEAHDASEASDPPDTTGTSTTAGTSAATREALRSACWEAMRLARALAAHPATASPEADAVAALLLLHGARLTGRVDAAGDIVPLAGQPRDRWDAGLVRMGLQHLQAAQRGGQLTRWHLLAGIAAEHAIAPRWEDTDWAAICRWYGWLVQADGSPAPRLGHAIALVESGAPERGQQALQALLPAVPAALRAHTLAALARAHERLGQPAQARDALAQAVAAAPSAADARLLQRRLDGLRAAQG